jgi:two-component system, OmpR family, phosphate regulon sensor histidine kinase PhoR
VAFSASGIRSRLASWWWDLPLRWKGFIPIALPSLVLLPSFVAVLLLKSSEDDLRSEARATLELTTLSADQQRDLLALENAVLVDTAGGGTPAPGDIWAELDPALDELVDRVSGSIRPQAEAATDAARSQRDALERLIEVAGAATPDRGAVDAARVEVQQRSAELASQFDALDAALVADLAATRVRIDDRGSQMMVVLVVGVLVATALSWGGMWVFTRGIVRRVETVRAVAARVIDGETSIDVEEPAHDELGTLIGELRRAAELLILHNVELEQSRNSERELVEREQTIREVVRRVHEAVGREEVLATTVIELGQATGSDGVLIFAVEDGAPSKLLAEWTAEGVVGLGVGTTLPPDEQRDANFGALMLQPHAVAVDDVAASGLLPQTRDLLGGLNVGSLLLAPVLGEQEPLAALVLITAGRSRPWPRDSERLAEAVAANVATALTNVRLYEREREMVHRLRDLDQAKSDFVASVSHELRTPLTSIRGYVEMLREGDAGELEPDQQRMLEVVERNTDRLLALIEDLLTLSRIESGAFRVARAPVALDGVARATVEELRPQASGRGVELVADVAGDVPAVLGDSAQLERVLLNLLSNAIKFTTDGGRVIVRVRSSGAAVELEVEDEGIGIPEAEQARLFSRFFRSSTAQERAIQGTGLGLVIVKSIIEHHGGEIAVRSQPGIGTTFTVVLPAAETTVGVA